MENAEDSIFAAKSERGRCIEVDMQFMFKTVIGVHRLLLQSKKEGDIHCRYSWLTMMMCILLEKQTHLEVMRGLQ